MLEVAPVVIEAMTHIFYGAIRLAEALDRTSDATLVPRLGPPAEEPTELAQEERP